MAGRHACRPRLCFPSIIWDDRGRSARTLRHQPNARSTADLWRYLSPLLPTGAVCFGCEAIRIPRALAGETHTRLGTWFMAACLLVVPLRGSLGGRGCGETYRLA